MKQLNWTKSSFIGHEVFQRSGQKPLKPYDENGYNLVNLYPDVKFNRFEGFGGAVTDAAAYVYSQMSAKQKQELIDFYFGKENCNYRVVRVPIDSCDFSLEHYEAMQNQNLADLDFSRELQYILPLLQDAQAEVQKSGETLRLLLSPWSPPAFMKTTGERNQGGELKPEFYALYADYLCAYIKEFQELGFLVERLTVQNEPEAVQTWDSCIYTAEEEKVFLRDHLYPAMKAAELLNVEIFIWDHNKERIFDRALATIDETTDKMVAGIAFHWYTGAHFEALRLVKEEFPTKKLILSEFCIAREYTPAGRMAYAHEIIGDLKHGTEAIYDWNLLLDEQGGPNHVGNYCDAPFRFDIEKGELRRESSVTNLWHLAHFIQPGAVRIATTCHTSRLELVAFENPDGSLAVTALNRTTESIYTVLLVAGQTFEINIEGKTLFSGLISVKDL